MSQIISISEKNIFKAIDRAVAILREGGIVAFPTDTVYGVGADTLNPKAVEKIYLAKRRPRDKPLPVLVSSIDDVRKVAAELPPIFAELTARFWPGALTLIVKAKDILPPEVTAGRKTIAVRMPDNRIALELIGRFGYPLATTSANLSGMPESVSAQEVQASLGDKVDLILDGGITAKKVASTVLDISIAPPIILRQGQIMP